MLSTAVLYIISLDPRTNLRLRNVNKVYTLFLSSVPKLYQGHEGGRGMECLPTALYLTFTCSSYCFLQPILHSKTGNEFSSLYTSRLSVLWRRLQATLPTALLYRPQEQRENGRQCLTTLLGVSCMLHVCVQYDSTVI